MPKYIKRITAKRCPVHQAITEECGQQLVEKGYFHKQQVLEKLNFTALEESIRWDYIAGFLSDPEGDHGIELVPLAQRFFASTRSERENTETRALGRYTAGGHGKKTAGYACVTLEGGRLAVRRAQQFKSLRNGTAEAFDRYVEAVLDNANKLENEQVVKICELQR